MTISFARHQFLSAIIQPAVWLYARFTLSYRDVEDLLAELGLDVSYGAALGLEIWANVRLRTSPSTPTPTSTWHLDEMAVTIAARQFWLCRAVDDEGEVLDLLVQRRRDKTAKSEMGLSARHEQCLRKNNRVENSHQPTRQR
jgi:putative transposase